MKKILNCKAILALAICLTMFAGLAMTASAASLPICSIHNTSMGTYGYVTCPNCWSSKAVRYVCKYYPSCNHYYLTCSSCHYSQGII